MINLNYRRLQPHCAGIFDVITINKALLGKEELTDEQLKAIDFNHNGKPDAEDSLKLMKFIAGLITSLAE